MQKNDESSCIAGEEDVDTAAQDAAKEEPACAEEAATKEVQAHSEGSAEEPAAEEEQPRLQDAAAPIEAASKGAGSCTALCDFCKWPLQTSFDVLMC